MIVYGDLLFLINFSMDFLCFYISCILLHIKLPTIRALLASVLGGIYAVAALFIGAGRGVSLALDLICCAIMCAIVFYSRKMRFFRIVKAGAVFLVSSALLGGVMTALFSLFNGLESFTAGLEISDGINAWIFALLAIVGTALSIGGGRLFRSSAHKKIVRLEIESDEGTTKLLCLVDSGNLAREPISGKSVVFASIDACKNALGEELYSALNACGNIGELPAKYAIRLRYVSSGGIAGNGLLPATKFNKTKLVLEKEEKMLDVYIAFVAANRLGEYDAIISSELI